MDDGFEGGGNEGGNDTSSDRGGESSSGGSEFGMSEGNSEGGGNDGGIEFAIPEGDGGGSADGSIEFAIPEGDGGGSADGSIEFAMPEGDGEGEDDDGSIEFTLPEADTNKTAEAATASELSEFEEWDPETMLDSKAVEGMIDNLGNVITYIKEHEDGTEAEKAESIRANINETMRNIGMSNLSPEEKVATMQRVYAGLEDGDKKDIYVPSDARFLNSETPFNDEGNPVYLWEGNMGFEGPPEKCELTIGQVVDRYGTENGSYVCEVKDGVPQNYESRALPYVENPGLYHQYEIVRDMEGFKSQIENLTVEEIEQIELQRDMEKPENERRSPEQLKEDAVDKYAAIIADVENTSITMYDSACKNGWVDDYKESELSAVKGNIKEAFSYKDENGVLHKQGGGEQICLPAGVDTLVYLGYMKEKE